MRILSIGIKELDENKFNPCNDSGTELNKPPFGTCLYGSTMIKNNDGSVGSDWGRFVQYDYTSKYFNYGISFTLNKSAKIIEIDNLNDYKNLLSEYVINEGFFNTIDFYKLSKDYDAFHVTEKAFWEMRLPILMNDEEYDFFYNKSNAGFYSYDAETWILFNLDCINKGSILNHNNIKYFYQ